MEDVDTMMNYNHSDTTLAVAIHDKIMLTYPEVDWHNLISELRDEYNVSDAEMTFAMNTPIHEWYYGNLVHGMLSMMFQPYLSFTQQFMSPAQLHRATVFLYELVSSNRIDMAFKDYYEATPYANLMFIKYKAANPWQPRPTHSLQEQPYPEYVRVHIDTVKNVFTKHEKMDRLARLYLRNWARKWRRRRDATLVIQAYWREFSMNPYTLFGAYMLHKRAHAWNTKYIMGNS